VHALNRFLTRKLNRQLYGTLLPKFLNNACFTRTREGCGLKKPTTLCLCLIFCLFLFSSSLFQLAKAQTGAVAWLSIYWQADNAATIDITNQATLIVNVSLTRGFTGSMQLIVNVTSADASIYPVQETITVAFGATETVYFTVTNPGGYGEVRGVPVTVNLYGPDYEPMYDQRTVYANMMATLSTETPVASILSGTAELILVILVLPVLVVILAAIIILATDALHRKQRLPPPEPPKSKTTVTENGQCPKPNN
jgi:hypothetical protein